MSNDYTNDGDVRAKIAETIECDIDEYSEKSAKRWRSRRLGSSAIGKSCSRRVWYGFRWAKQEEFGSANRPAGRVFRLFNRGHREEPQLVKLLEGIGCTFYDPPDGQDQFQYAGIHDHAITKLDGICQMPERFGVTDPVMVEMKTASFSNFNKMQKKGIQVEQPGYWEQVHYSGALSGLKYVLFVVVNKNDDNIHCEFHQLDHDFGQMLLNKAEHIITAPTDQSPLKIAQSPTNFACKHCPYIDICHNDEQVEVNCRSCKFSEAAVDGQWVCKNPAFDFDEMVIPGEVIEKGCPYHVGIK